MDALESLDVWKKACRLAVDVYALLEQCRDLGFKDQVTRSAVSIASNIAEGYERDYTPELIRFLRIAKGSAGELRTQIYIGIKVGLVDPVQGKICVEASREISKMLQGLVKFCQNK